MHTKKKSLILNNISTLSAMEPRFPSLPFHRSFLATSSTLRWLFTKLSTVSLKMSARHISIFRKIDRHTSIFRQHKYRILVISRVSARVLAFVALTFFFHDDTCLPRCGVFTLARVSTFTFKAPLLIITLLHSFTVVPVVNTSSTRHTFAP